MKKNLLFFSLLIVFSSHIYCQNNEVKESGISFKIQSIGLFLYNSDAFDYYVENNTLFGKNNSKSKIENWQKTQGFLE